MKPLGRKGRPAAHKERLQVCWKKDGVGGTELFSRFLLGALLNDSVDLMSLPDKIEFKRDHRYIEGLVRERIPGARRLYELLYSKKILWLDIVE